MSSWLLLALGTASAYATVSALIRLHRPATNGFVVMLVSWLTGEYPIFHIGIQMVVVVVLRDGVDRAVGYVGLGLFVASWVGLVVVRVIQRRARSSGESALRAGLGGDYLDEIPTERRTALRTRSELGLVLLPLRFSRRGIDITRDLPYGTAKRNVLDVYRPMAANLPDGPLPVVLQVHGGGWVIGNKAQQGQPLLSRLVPTGFVGVSVNYRLGPRSVFPAQLIDVKQAIAWVKEHVAEYGGDPDRIVITGGSAGGHLSSLAALTPNEAAYQPTFEDVDTSVMACIDFYGPSDFTDRLGLRGRLSSYEVFLSRVVMPGKLADHADLYAAMSPIEHVNPGAPPFLVIQGELDVLVWREESEAFAEQLAAVSQQPVVYWEVPGAQHAFDTFNSNRSAAAVDVCERFAAVVDARSTRSSGDERR